MGKIVYDGFHKIEELEVNIKGEKRKIEKLGINHAVAGIVCDADNKIALVVQYRPCVDEVMYEIPAGLLDKNESLQETLIQELEEECEINRNNIARIIELPLNYYMACGSSDAEMNILMVKLNSVEETKKVDDCDVEKVKWLSFNDFKTLVLKGKIKDGKTLMSYYVLDKMGF